MNIDIFLKLLCAHFLCDFVLQSNEMCRLKRLPLFMKNTLRSATYKSHICHSLIHSIFAYIFVFQYTLWIPFVYLFLAHISIDVVKSRIQNCGFNGFLVDQLLHVIVLIFLWIVFFQQRISYPLWFPNSLSIYFNNSTIWIYILAYILVLTPSSVFLSLFMNQCITLDREPNQGHKTLKNAGKIIGYCERILILTFLLMDQVAGVGFLLAAKSIFRFGDLREPDDINKTEYVLIGTFSSFAIAVAIGSIVKVLVN